MTIDPRRRYWTDTMDLASAFMRSAIDVPVIESGERLVDLGTIAGPHFEIAPSATDELGIALVRESLVEPFEAIADSLNRRGLMPVVQYAYRSPLMQQTLLTSAPVLDRVVDRATWEFGREAVTPELAYDRLIVLCANSFATGTHLAGTALDVMTRRIDSDEAFDLGGSYLTISENTPMASPFVSAAARRNRDDVSAAFVGQGFYHYPFEFWHYSRDDVYGVLLGQSEAPARHGPVYVDVTSGEPTRVAAPAEELLPRDELLEMLAARLRDSKPQ